jgi:hypothetical protein
MGLWDARVSAVTRGSGISLGGLVAAAVLVLCGCAAEEQAAPTQESPSTEDESPSPENPEDLALEAYEGMWDAYIEASHDGDTDPEDLDRYAMGQAAEHIRENLAERVEAGEVATGEPSFAPEVAEVEEHSVVLHDCMDATDWLRVDAESGEPVEEVSGDPVHRPVHATAEYDALSWRISELLIGQLDDPC